MTKAQSIARWRGMVKAGGGGHSGRLACTRSPPSSSCLGEQLCPCSIRLSIKYSCSKPKSGYFSVLNSLEVVGPQLSPRPGLAQFFSLSPPVASSLFSTKCRDSFLLPQRPLSSPWAPAFMPPLWPRCQGEVMGTLGLLLVHSHLGSVGNDRSLSDFLDSRKPLRSTLREQGLKAWVLSSDLTEGQIKYNDDEVEWKF